MRKTTKRSGITTCPDNFSRFTTNSRNTPSSDRNTVCTQKSPRRRSSPDNLDSREEARQQSKGKRKGRQNAPIPNPQSPKRPARKLLPGSATKCDRLQTSPNKGIPARVRRTFRSAPQPLPRTDSPISGRPCLLKITLTEIVLHAFFSRHKKTERSLLDCFPPSEVTLLNY